MEQKPQDPVDPAPAREGTQDPSTAGQPAGAAPGAKPGRNGPVTPPHGPTVDPEDLQALLDRFKAMEARNRDLKKQFEALPAETHLQNLQRKMAHVKDWLDDEEKEGSAAERTRTHPEPADGLVPAGVPGEGAARTDAEYEPLPAEGVAGFIKRLPSSRVIIAIVAVSGILAAVSLFRGPSSFSRYLTGRAGAPQDPGIVPPAVLEKQKGPDVRSTAADHQVGLAYYKDRWLSVDWSEGKIFELDPATGLKFLRGFPNSFTTGLSAGDKALWSIDAFNRRCYKHDPETFSILASFTTPGPSPSAVHWDGDSLWLADKETRRAYKYLNMKTSAITLVQYQLLETEPVGLWKTGDLLWVLDRAEKTVRRYRLEGDGKLSTEDTLRLSAWLPAKTRPIGMALKDDELWLLTETPCLLYRYSLDSLPWTEGGPSGN